MIPLRLIVPAVLAASAAAGCITYFVTPLAQVETDQRLPPTLPNVIGPTTGASSSCWSGTSEEEKAAAAFQQAAEAILRRAPNTRASDEPPITGHIPVAKKAPNPSIASAQPGSRPTAAIPRISFRHCRQPNLDVQRAASGNAN